MIWRLIWIFILWLIGWLMPVAPPTDYQTMIDEARQHALNFEYDRAIALIDEVLVDAEANSVPADVLAELYTVRAEMVFLLYEWDRVLADLNTALALAPDYAPAYFQRGVLYYTMADREAALADFERYLRLHPEGVYATEATRYRESIEIELQALGD